MDNKIFKSKRLRAAAVIIGASSLLLNFIFILAFALASAQGKKTSFISFAPPRGLAAAAAIACAPASSPLAFGTVEFYLKPGEKAFLQYAAIDGGRQSNLIIDALYDPEIVSVARRGAGIEIAALRAGETLLQRLSASGIADVALVRVAGDGE